MAVGNKIDKSNREVTRAEGIEFARTRGMLFIECSAKAKTGIQQVTEFVCACACACACVCACVRVRMCLCVCATQEK
jgi:hypothetical protein